MWSIRIRSNEKIKPEDRSISLRGAPSGFFSLNAGIQWIEKNHDFGLMKEILGPQTGVSRLSTPAIPRYR